MLQFLRFFPKLLEKKNFATVPFSPKAKLVNWPSGQQNQGAYPWYWLRNWVLWVRLFLNPTHSQPDGQIHYPPIPNPKIFLQPNPTQPDVFPLNGLVSPKILPEKLFRQRTLENIRTEFRSRLENFLADSGGGGRGSIAVL